MQRPRPVARSSESPRGFAAVVGAAVLGCASPPLEDVPPGFELHPEFRLELVAAEPVVVDPIDLAFDERAQAFVLELPGYPDMKRPARIVTVSDTDGDGRWDRRRLFAGDLGMADSILPWRDGLLVAAPPDILYLEDTDGDGKADRREVLLSGFAEGNPQHNVNALRYGLDNWVYGVNGGNGARPFWPEAPEEAVELGQDDFRVDLRSRRFEPTGRGAGGFGMTFGVWGRSFATHNLDHLSQLVIPRRYLGRLPLSGRSGRLRLAAHPDGGPAELFPIGVRQTRPNHPEQSSRFSAACAVTAYGGGAFEGTGLTGESLAVFVADPSANVVHRAVVDTSGAAAEAGRGRPGVEFLASTDPLFRPVNLRVGPDGALYVLDMHRGVIEHPEWIPDSVEAALDLYEGDDRGRVYRVVPARGLPAWVADGGRLDRSRTADLVQALGHPNRWRRLTAQRLLVQEHSAEPPAALVTSLRERVLETDNALGRLHAMWSLAGLGALDRATLEALLGDPHPELRRNAVLALEELLQGGAPSNGFAKTLVGLIEDPEPAVRLQAILTAGLLLESEVYLGPEFGRSVASAVVAGTGPQPERDGPWLRLAAVAVLADDPVAALRLLLASGGPVDPGGEDVVERVAALVPGKRLGEVIGDSLVLGTLSEAGAASAGVGRALLAGLTAAASGAGSAELVAADLGASLRRLRRSSDDPLAESAWRMTAALGVDVSPEEIAFLDGAGRRAGDVARDVGERLEALALFGLRRFWPGEAFAGGPWVERMGSLMDAGHPAPMQRAAMAELAAADEAAVTAYVIDRWPYLGTAARRDAGSYLIRGRGRHRALLDALESGRIRLGEMNFILERRRFLLRSPDQDIRSRAAALFDDAGVTTRAEAIAAMRPALELDGEPERGETLFLELCARCHQSGGLGFGPGPDLDGIGRKSAENLLHDILDPNAAVDARYVNYIVETTEGEVLSGILDESPGGGVVLRAAEGSVIEVPAERIREVRSDGLSMMPEELEAGLEPGDLADLLAFLSRA
ncbi:MAG: c-type cytochrome [Acidobacteria bacterium]|nr:c-type cytochrome [Acidobacteriota bacterium]